MKYFSLLLIVLALLGAGCSSLIDTGSQLKSEQRDNPTMAREVDEQGHGGWVMRAYQFHVLVYRVYSEEIVAVIFPPYSVVPWGDFYPGLVWTDDNGQIVAMPFNSHQEAQDFLLGLPNRYQGRSIRLYDLVTNPELWNGYLIP